MANSVQDHIHLWAVGATFTGTRDHEYHITMAGIKAVPVAIVSHVRGLNGASHSHTLVDVYAAPILIKDAVLKPWVTQAQLDALSLLQGKQCYYIPISHMDDGDAHAAAHVALTPGYKVFMMQLADDQMLDPMMQYWTVTLTLKDDSF